MARTLGLLIAFVFAFGVSGQTALAAGGGGGTSSKPKSAAFLEAASLVKDKKFADAIPLLTKAVESDPKDADAHNLLGYSHRKLGDFDSALGHYKTAIKLDPDHLGANEYLGELYLQIGDLEKAEERLSKLDWACLFGCEEYSELKEAIAAYKAKNGN